MAKFDVAALAAPALESGEEVLGWIRVNYSGQTEPPAKRRVGIAALGDTHPPTPEQLATFPAHRQMVLVLTGGRILAYTISMTGKPKGFGGEVPIAVLTGCQFEPSRLGGHLSIDMVSLVNVRLDITDGDGEGFASELAASIAAIEG